MNSIEKTNDLHNNILFNNKILYCMYKRPMTETCMCWGLEVPDVWLNEIESLSQRLEAANIIFYPKYNVRIQADQVKDKFAHLAYYYSIVVDPPKWICIYEKCIRFLMSVFTKIDYKLKRIVDKDAYDEVVEEPIVDMSFEDAVKTYKNASNVKIINKDNAILKQTTLHHCAKVHYEATQHKLLHKIFNYRYYIESFIRNLIHWHPTYKQLCIRKMLEKYVDAAIAASEKECSCICEKCGRHIGESYSPRCITYGWISYLCNECADKLNMLYSKNGEVWKNKKLIKNKDGKLINEN